MYAHIDLSFPPLQHEIFQNYSSISFMPEEFGDYLLSPAVGFVECLPLGTPDNPSRGLLTIIVEIQLISCTLAINKYIK